MLGRQHIIDSDRFAFLIQKFADHFHNTRLHGARQLLLSKARFLADYGCLNHDFVASLDKSI